MLLPVTPWALFEKFSKTVGNSHLIVRFCINEGAVGFFWEAVNFVPFALMDRPTQANPYPTLILLEVQVFESLVIGFMTHIHHFESLVISLSLYFKPK